MSFKRDSKSFKRDSKSFKLGSKSFKRDSKSFKLGSKSFNPLSPKIDFYVDLLICATSWASNHKFMLLSKIFQETYYL